MDPSELVAAPPPQAEIIANDPMPESSLTEPASAPAIEPESNAKTEPTIEPGPDAFLPFRDGDIMPLRTKGEFDARVVTEEAWVVALTPRFASDALALIRQHFPSCADFDLTHLRRFVKYAYLPSYVRFYAWWYNGAHDPRWDSRPELHNTDRTLLYLLTVPASVPKEELLDVLMNKSSGELQIEFEVPPLILATRVPVTPPLSQLQADDMSSRFWPTVYKSANPFGPHLSIWARAKARIGTTAPAHMALAHKAAEAAYSSGIGIRVGAVVVDRRADSVQVLAVAGDARWMGLGAHQIDPSDPPDPCCHSGNVMAHAAMRAIDMVARKRARAGKRTRVIARPDGEPVLATLPPPVLDPSNLFYPQTDVEKRHFDTPNADPDGYLCLNHEIYLTHEPCVMCSMAILHSRFAVCVFGQPMIRTGGLRAGGQMFDPTNLTRPTLKRKLPAEEGRDAEVETESGVYSQAGDWLSSGGPLPTYKVPYNGPDERGGVLFDPEVEEEEPANSRVVRRLDDSTAVESSCFGLFWRPELNWKFLTWQWIDRVDPSGLGISPPAMSEEEEQELEGEEEGEEVMAPAGISKTAKGSMATSGLQGLSSSESVLMGSAGSAESLLDSVSSKTSIDEAMSDGQMDDCLTKTGEVFADQVGMDVVKRQAGGGGYVLDAYATVSA